MRRTARDAPGSRTQLSQASARVTANAGAGASACSDARAGSGTAVPASAHPDHNQRLGAEGERIAAEYLEQLGYTILDRNWRIREGEIDLVARDGSDIVAVEVKTRGGSGYGHPLEAITAIKARRLRRLLLSWVRETRPGLAHLRIDAIGITMRNGERPRIDHLRGIS